MFNKNLPKPRYTEVWDVDRVLQHVKRMGENDPLSIKAISEKLAMSIALVSASRCSEIHKLNPLSMIDKGNGESFLEGEFSFPSTCT